MKNFASERINEKINDIKRCQKLILGENFWAFLAKKVPNFPKNEIKKCQKYVFGQFLAKFWEVYK